jgi:hypothetical protein
LRWLKAEFFEVWQSRLTTSQFEKMYLRPRTCRLRCSVVDALAADEPRRARDVVRQPHVE